MSPQPLRDLVRRFSENGLKHALANAVNVRDLLRLARLNVIDLIDFEHMSVVQTTFVKRDYRNLEADLVLRAPLRRPDGGRERQILTIYILLEHQSEPARLMPLTLLDYVVQIYKAQLRAGRRGRKTLGDARLHPVLPVVLYTGTRRWDGIGQLVDLVELGDLFADETPAFKPLFVNLNALPADRLEREGGFFGWVLRLVQERHARPAEFRDLLERVVLQLEEMPAAERLRWLELLSYVHALVYHVRNPVEHDALQETIEASVGTDELRQEVKTMGKTIADALMEKGEIKGRKEGRKEGRKVEAVRVRRDILLLQLRTKFGDLSRELVGTIEATTNVKRLNAWLERTVTATTLADVGVR